MDTYKLVSLFCAAFGIYVTINETRNIRKLSSISIINLFGYMYGVTYGFLPAVTLWMYAYKGLELSHSYHRIDYSERGISQIIFWVILSVIGYFVLRTSYNISYSRHFKRLRQEMLVNENQYIQADNSQQQQKMFSKLQVAMIICFGISVVSLYLWLRAYGGIWELIKIADEVRDGNSSISNSLAFFMRPAKMIMIVVYMSLVLMKYKYKTHINFIFFSISFVLSILMLLALDGRMAMGMFLVIVILLAKEYLRVGEFSWKKARKMLLLAVVALIVMFNMDTVTYYIRNGHWKNSTQTTPLVESVLLEFSYIITGAQHAVSKLISGECPYLIKHDIIAGMFAWFPSSLRPEGIINIWDYNTELCTIGSTIYGQLPCDFITTSIYSLGVLGSVVFGVFWGFLIKTIDYVHFKWNNPISDIFYYAIAMRIFRLVNYCLLYDFVLGLFDIVIAFIIWSFCKHIKWTSS